MEKIHERATQLDWSGEPPSLENGMTVHPTGGKTRAGGKYEVTDAAMGNQIHRVVEERPRQCVATVRLQIPAELHISSSFSNRSEPNPNIGAFQRRMSEDDPIVILCTRV